MVQCKQLAAGFVLLCGAAMASLAQPHPSAVSPGGPAVSSGSPVALWQAYASSFLSSDGRVIDPQGANRTTSEGQSYALFFALVNNDRARFDQVLAWTQSNLAGGNLGPHLPAWEWGHRKDGTWGQLDPNSAADSDLWIAYDLLEAGRLWHLPAYTAIALRMLHQIARRETTTLPSFGPVLLPGEYGFHLKGSWILNPCYTPLFLLRRLAKADPTGPWAGIAMLQSSLIEHSSPGGFAMDWVSYTPGSGFLPSRSNSIQTDGALGSYDAIRVYTWAGMTSSEEPSRAAILAALHGMRDYLLQHNAPPEKVNAMGVPLPNDGPVGFSAAVLPFLLETGQTAQAQKQLQRVESQLDEKTGLYGKVPTYYDQNLILFGLGWSQRQFRFSPDGELWVTWQQN